MNEDMGGYVKVLEVYCILRWLETTKYILGGRTVFLKLIFS
jgi:hypothetical protein